MPFHKLLIANRGEIALRIARTARRLGLAVATVHSQADAQAPHVREIGESRLLGPAPAAESYLSIERVVAAAQAVGADAVHPGYGFLSENAAFAQALQAAGIAFVGPEPRHLRDFGDKAAAKRLAIEAGVPVIPGSELASADPDAVAAMARRLGGAVLLKAAAGGGGKGIRIVDATADDAEAREAIAAAMREGRNAFGDASLLVERYLPQGRHVEVQIIGDGRGGVRHLWERECSLQRRHQKVVEEAPALRLPPGLRQRLLDAAVALGRRVGYRALGTVEFLVVGDEFFFLEVNPRLQVEHPVTEAVTGLDLVALQLRAAAGELDLDALPEPRCEGHAIELRLYAEDPEQDFLPATGRVQRLQWPPGPVRVETGIEAGSIVTPHYDPMLAKLIVHGADRAEAIARSRAALAATRVAGFAHNLVFLEMLLASPEVADAVPHTGTIDALAGRRPPRAAWRDAVAAMAAAWVFEQSRQGDAAQPVSQWPGFTHWRLDAPGPRPPLQPQYECSDASGRACKAAVSNDGAGADARLQVQIDGEPRRHALRFGPAGLLLDDVAWPLAIGQDDGRVWISDGRHTEVLTVNAAAAAQRRAGGAAGAAVTAPMTGKLLELRVREGDAVRAGQVLALLESMKMEMRLAAPHDGIVAAVDAAAGATVERGAVLLTVAPLASPTPPTPPTPPAAATSGS